MEMDVLALSAVWKHVRYNVALDRPRFCSKLRPLWTHDSRVGVSGSAAANLLRPLDGFTPWHR